MSELYLFHKPPEIRQLAHCARMREVKSHYSKNAWPSTDEIICYHPGNAGRQSFRESLWLELPQPPAERTRRDGISAGVTDGRRFYEYQPCGAGRRNLGLAGLVGADAQNWLKRCTVIDRSMQRMPFNGQEINALTTQQKRLQLGPSICR